VFSELSEGVNGSMLMYSQGFLLAYLLHSTCLYLEIVLAYMALCAEASTLDSGTVWGSVIGCMQGDNCGVAGSRPSLTQRRLSEINCLLNHIII